MNQIIKYTLFIVACLFGITSTAQKGDFLFKRKLQNVSDQWHKIPLPDDIFSKINPDFSDVRILGITQKNDTIEIPYLLNNPSKQEILKEIPFRLINESRTGNRYYFTFDALESRLINEIHLDFNDTNFDWKVKLEGSQNLQEWFSIVENYRILSIKNSATDFKFTKLEFPESQYRYFRISFEAGNKPVLQSAKITRKQQGAGVLKNCPVASQSINEDSKFKQTVISIGLKERVPLAFVKITIKGGIDYYRPVTISALSDSIKNGNDWRYFYRSLTSGILESNTPNTFNVENSIVKDVKIIIENRDNQPLKIDSVTVSGYQYELTARFTDPAEYYLFYGNKKASKPDYDIARFVENIPGDISTLSTGKEEVIKKEDSKKTSSLFENKNWMWLIMGIIIITLGWFSISMMKKKQ